MSADLSAALSATLIMLALFYAALLGSAALGFVRLRTSMPGSPAALPSVTILIPARNEARSIGACIDSVMANAYPSDRLEVIVVDDGSADGTASVVRKRMAADPGTAAHNPTETRTGCIRLITLADDPARDMAHKKFALARGVEEARGEIILTTDADCTVAPTWILSMVGEFDDATGMVTGPVLYRDDRSFFGRVQALEFLGLVALGAGMIGAGRPHLCNSANLAYRRQAYREVGGYEGLEDVTTGDDEMLLHRLAYESPWKVRTCMDRSAVVETDANGTVREFFSQRTRWASAHARYPHVRLTATSVLCYSFFVALVAAGLAGQWYVVGGALLLKLAAEASILRPATARFDRKAHLPLLAPAQLLHVPYILVIGIAGTFGGYEWKGRRLAQ